MEEGNALRKRGEQHSENYLRFREKSAIILLYIYGVGGFISFLRLPEGWWFDIEVLTTTGKSIFSG